ncbi:EVI2B protein, partial [Upupa epops]|nr:EVI2B protein [Upupa epops]
MASNQAVLVLLCAEVWTSLSTAVPPTPLSERNAPPASVRSPAGGKAPPDQRHATERSTRRAETALTVTTPGQFPTAHPEPVDDGWVAALVIGVILASMITAIAVIVLWKYCKRPALVDSNWAGRSPFADGDTPDVFMDSDEAPKRSSVLFTLPWKLKQDTNLRRDPPAAEKPPACAAANGPSPSPPPANRISVSSVDATPAPAPAPCEQESCPQAAASPQMPDLPPPPDWLREPAECRSSDVSKLQEPRLETEERLPPPPRELCQETEPPSHPL